jgi:hypothetical protein
MEKILQQLTGKHNVESVSKDELRHLTDSCTYFAPAQFLLAAKLKKENNKGFLSQAQKTVLFFNNPFWMHYQLQNTTTDTDITIGHPTYQEEYKPILNHVIEEDIHQSSFAIPTVEEVKDMMREIDHQDEIVTQQTPTVVDDNTTVTHDEPANTEVEEIIEEAISTKVDEQEPVAVLPEPEVIIHEHVEPINTLDLIDEPTPIHHPQQQSMAIENNAHVQEAKTAIKEEEIVGQEDTVVDEHSIKIAAVLNSQLAEFNKPITTDTPIVLDTEPYHTVDYFASQGIKVNLEQPPIDKLTSQLRRFTDWLKHIKNVEPDEEDINTDPELESAIQGIASSSNEAREIVTETMAEVLEKQGKKDKAIQLYIKLSFLNPDKSAYFASKIQQLKGI